MTVSNLAAILDPRAPDDRDFIIQLSPEADEELRLTWGEARARIWRLYMAGSAVNFEANRTQIHQLLGVKPNGDNSEMPLRPEWEPLT